MGGRLIFGRGILAAGITALFLTISCSTGISREEAAQVYFNLGNAYFDLGRHTEAVTAYRHALELDESLTRASYNLARVYIDTGKFEEAFDVLEMLLAKEPQNAILLEVLAWGKHLTGNDEEALEIYRTILERDDQNANALYNASIILWNSEHLDEAEDMLLRLYDLTPGKEDMLYALGRLEEEIGNYLLAVDYLEQYTGKRSDDAEAWSLLGNLYVELEIFDKSIDAYNNVLEHDANNAEALFCKAQILLTAIEDIDEGMAVLEQAVTAGFRDASRLRTLISDPDGFGHDRIMDFLLDRNLLSEENVAEPEATEETDASEELDTDTDADDSEPDSGE